MNILITSASRKVTLVKKFQEAIKNNGRVIAADITSLAPALYFADDYVLVPMSEDTNFMETMLRLCHEMEIKLLVPTRDEELPLFAAAKNDFKKIGTTVMVADPEIIGVCQDKQRFAEFCQNIGLKTPRMITPAQAKNGPFPVFVKPRFGKGSKSIARADSKNELECLLENTPDAVIQEYIDATEYTIDLFSDFNSRVLSAIPRQRVVIFGGESFVTRTVKEPTIIDQSVKLAMELKLICHNTLQCFYDCETVKFIEVNPRFGGAAHLSFEAGAPSPYFLVSILQGKTVEPVIDFKEDLFMLRYTDDVFVQGFDLRGKTLS